MIADLSFRKHVNKFLLAKREVGGLAITIFNTHHQGPSY